MNEQFNSDLKENIADKARVSLMWVMSTSIIVKGLSFIAQVVMGWYLTQKDFGVFAIAWAIIGLASFVREGGSRDYLIQQGPLRYGELVGPLFWMAMTITMGLSAILVCTAGLIAAFPGSLPPAYRAPQLPWLLVMGAILLALSTPSAFTSAKLQLELRFDTFSRVQIGSGFIRYGVMIGLAVSGYGPFSFMWAYIAVQIYELLVLGKIVGVNLFRLPAKPQLWRGYLSLTIWLTVGFLGNFLVEWSSAAGVGLFANDEEVGLYYFAFNIVAQIVVLISVNAQYVLMPALSRLNEEPERQGLAILKITRSLMLVASGLCLGFAVIADSVMEFIWRSKWEQAVMPMQIFCIFFPMRMTYGLTLAIMQAKGQFKRWAATSLLEGAAIFTAAATGAWIGVHVPGAIRLVGSTAAVAALCVGLAIAVARSLVTADTLKRAGITPLQCAAAQYTAWAIGLFAAGICWWLDYSLIGREQWAEFASSLGEQLHLPGRLAGETLSLLRGGVLGLVFAVLFVGTTRLILHRHVADALSLAPRRIRGLVARFLVMTIP